MVTAQQVLHGLLLALKLTVIREFAPHVRHTRHVGRDVDGIFLRFVESVDKRKGHHIGKGKGFTKGMPLPAAVPVAVPFAAPPGLTAEPAISREMLLSFRGRCDLQASTQVPPAPYRMVPSSSLELQVTAGKQDLTPEQRITLDQLSNQYNLDIQLLGRLAQVMTRRKATFVEDAQTARELEAGATARAQFEDKAHFAKDTNSGLDQLKVEMDKLERYITEYSRDLETQKAHLGTMLRMREALAKRMATTRI